MKGSYVGRLGGRARGRRSRRGRALDALEDDPLVGGRPVDVVRAEEPAVSGGDGGGQPADVARLRRDAEVEFRHCDGVVHHDAYVEGRATSSVA